MISTSTVYRNKFLSWLYCHLSQLRALGYKTEVERRARFGIFDYKAIAQPLPKCYYELCTDNNSFGIGWSIRKYVGSKKNYINAFVEHGYFFGTYVQDVEKITFAKKILTFGDVRKEHIKAVVNNKEIIPIGPYIYYAPDYYDEKRFAEEKAKLGRTLLVFFSHSGTGERVSFDLDALIEKINGIKKNFKTVVVSLFWSDINSEIEKRLKDEGYLIFSSGHRYDYYFLSRQKTMIQLADVTMSNFVSTHVAYCSCLNKPHWIIRQEIDFKALNAKGATNVAIGQKIAKENESIKEQEELYQAFAEFSTVLTERQRAVCDKYFGLSYMRTVEEMREILQ